MKLIKTEFVESQSVGYRQIRLTFPDGRRTTYFQEFKSTEGWFNLHNGVKAPATLAHFLDQQAAAHKANKAAKIAALERGESMVIAANG